MSAQLDFEWELVALVDRYRLSVSKTELATVLVAQVGRVFKGMSGELAQLQLPEVGASPQGYGGRGDAPPRQ